MNVAQALEFFSGKISGSNVLFHGSTFDSFSNSVHLLCSKERKTSIEEQKYKGSEKRDRIIVSKVQFSFQISRRNQNITYRSSFFFQCGHNSWILSWQGQS